MAIVVADLYVVIQKNPNGKMFLLQSIIIVVFKESEALQDGDEVVSMGSLVNPVLGAVFTTCLQTKDPSLIRQKSRLRRRQLREFFCNAQAFLP